MGNDKRCQQSECCSGFNTAHQLEWGWSQTLFVNISVAIAIYDCGLIRKWLLERTTFLLPRDYLNNI